MTERLLTPTRKTGHKPPVRRERLAAALTVLGGFPRRAHHAVIAGLRHYAVFATGTTNAFAAGFHSKPSVFARSLSSFFTGAAAIGAS